MKKLNSVMSEISLGSLFIIFINLTVKFLVLMPWYVNTNEGMTFFSKFDTLNVFSNSSFESTFLIISVLAICFLQLGFLFSKSKTTTLFSVGVNRKTLFFKRFLLPVVLLCSVVLITKTFCLIGYISNLGVTSEGLKTYALSILSSLCPAIYTAGAVCLAITFSRTVPEGIVNTGLFCGFAPAVIYVIKHIFSMSLYGTSVYCLPDGRYEVYSFYDLYNPYNLIVRDESYTQYTAEEFNMKLAGAIIWIAVGIAALAFSRYWIKKSFKVENSGKKWENKYFAMGSLAVVQIILLAFLSFYIYRRFFLLYENIESYGKMIGMYILVGVLFALVSALIALAYTKKKQGAINGALSAALSTAFACILILIGASGVFGSYNLAPVVNDIESVQVSMPFESFDAFKNASVSILGNSEFVEFEYLELTDRESIEATVDIHSKILGEGEKEYYMPLSFVYKMKNGSIVRRYYFYVNSEACDAALTLWDTKEMKELYKKKLVDYPTLLGDDTPDDKDIAVSDSKTARIYIISKYYNSTSVAENLDESKITQLKKAIYEDIANLNHKDYFLSPTPQLGVIDIFQSVSGDHIYLTFYVTEKCKKTIAFLKENDLYDLLSYKDSAVDFESAYLFSVKDLYPDAKELGEPLKLTELSEDDLFYFNINDFWYNLYSRQIDTPVFEHNSSWFGYKDTSKDVIAYNMVNDITEIEEIIEDAYMLYYNKKGGRAFILTDENNYSSVQYWLPDESTVQQ